MSNKTQTITQTEPKDVVKDKVTKLTEVQKLRYFITMYNIDKDSGSKDQSKSSQSVWNSSGKRLSTTSEYNGVSVSVSADTEFPKGDFGILETGRLNKMLGVVKDKLVVTKTTNQLKFKNGQINFDYHLYDPSVINDEVEPVDTSSINYGSTISLTKDGMDNFISCYNTFPSDVKSDVKVTIWKNKSSKYYLTLSQENSHTMTLPVSSILCDELDGDVIYDASIWYNCFTSNPKCDGVEISLSDIGVCNMVFGYGRTDKGYVGFNSNYTILPNSEDESSDDAEVSEELEVTSDPMLDDEVEMDVSINSELEPELVEGV